MYYVIDKKKETMKSWQACQQLSNSLLKKEESREPIT